MKYNKNIVKEMKIAYIGGGSRGWAWSLMGDLSLADDLSGQVFLYDIDFEAAKCNEHIGNSISALWHYTAVQTLGEALVGADVVIISILPGTFDEMASDVHTPEAYGIYQSVGDTTGPGGFMRAMRTIPMMRVIAGAVREYCPSAWVINYTNPMAICVQTLYREFPQMKAFGCCHEVFGTQETLARMMEEYGSVSEIRRDEIEVNVVGVNHFTWFTKARYHDIDLFDVFDECVKKYGEKGYLSGNRGNWVSNTFCSAERVKMDLFRRFGFIAAAGDRHLAEFMDADDYLASPEAVRGWMFGLTTVDWRKEDLKARLARSRRLVSGEERFTPSSSGEEGVRQLRALFGLTTLFTNVNLPNVGQIPNLPLGAVVETNAVFRSDYLAPVYAGAIPGSIESHVRRIALENNEAVEAGFSESFEVAYQAFSHGHLLTKLSEREKHELFDKMVENTKSYLKNYH